MTIEPRLIALAGLALSIAACSAPAPPVAAPTSAVTLAPRAPTSVTAPPTATTAPAEKKALVQAALGNLSKTLHPYPDSTAYTQAWIDAAALIWGGADGGGALLAFDWDTLDYRPAMATGMPTVSSDGKTFTFVLRDDLKWSDGTAVTVDDFQYAYDQASREDNRYVQLDILQDIASFRAIDHRTIQATLKSARPHDLSLGIVNVVTPIPTHVWKGRSWTDSSANPEILNPSVVLGPFAVQEFKSAERGVFTALDTYYVGKPHVPRVEILANQQPSAAYEALKSGRVNWVRALPPAQYQEAEANPDLVVQEWTAANATYRTIEFNLMRPFLAADKRVRQALAYAVNRTDLLDLAEQTLAVPQFSFVQPTNQRWVNTAVTRYDQDMARARQLLQEVGGSLDPDLGPRAQLVTNGQQNVTGYSNPQVDELFRQAATTLDEAKRKQMYDQIQTLVNADLPSHYLYALKSIDAFSRQVHGVVPSKGDRLDYNDALLAWSVSE